MVPLHSGPTMGKMLMVPLHSGPTMGKMLIMPLHRGPTMGKMLMVPQHSGPTMDKENRVQHCQEKFYVIHSVLKGCVIIFEMTVTLSLFIKSSIYACRTDIYQLINHLHQKNLDLIDPLRSYIKRIFELLKS